MNSISRNVIKEELFLFKKEYNKALTDEDPLVGELLNYLQEDTGKTIRPILFFLSQGLIGKPDQSSIHVAVILELLHNATIIHDDVVDNGEKRRGRESAHRRWSRQSSVLLGDFLLAKILKIGLQSKWPEVLDVTSNVVFEMAREELSQSLKRSITVPEEDEYFNTIQLKTAGLFESACLLGGIIAGADKEYQNLLASLGMIYGMVFQIRDDVLDYTGTEDETGKEVRKDLMNGSITLPLIYTYRTLAKEKQKQLIEFIRSGDRDKINFVYDFVVESGGIEKSQEKASELLKQTLNILDKFPDSNYRKALYSLTDGALTRIV
ncbi:polyprenyl synthetase family protein [bacterium]|nr:polyprenyl synthetase family protein [bacterium]